ncbi:hypothetical protein ASZ90_014790 [hydrocarbon metagenome]|uniref:Uncharacterized protein n=1 Tax=hydrocarbon metagenome TaxID=938273 RepID=A0A0W8F3V3_9ZZZZ
MCACEGFTLAGRHVRCAGLMNLAQCAHAQDSPPYQVPKQGYS